MTPKQLNRYLEKAVKKGKFVLRLGRTERCVKFARLLEYGHFTPGTEANKDFELLQNPTCDEVFIVVPDTPNIRAVASKLSVLCGCDVSFMVKYHAMVGFRDVRRASEEDGFPCRRT